MFDSPPPDERLLTRDEVDAYFGISRRFLELAALNGDGPLMVRVGKRSVRYRAGDIRDWVEGRTVNNTSVEVAP